MNRSIIHILYSGDHQQRVVIFRTDDDSYGFEVERYSSEPLEHSWIPVGGYSQSFCASEAIVMREVLGRVGWLAEMVHHNQPIEGLPFEQIIDPPPPVIDGARVILYAHRCKGYALQVTLEMAWPAVALAICQYPGESAFYVFGCDAHWNVIYDNFHETLESAKDEADSCGVALSWKELK